MTSLDFSRECPLPFSASARACRRWRSERRKAEGLSCGVSDTLIGKTDVTPYLPWMTKVFYFAFLLSLTPLLAEEKFVFEATPGNLPKPKMFPSKPQVKTACARPGSQDLLRVIPSSDQSQIIDFIAENLSESNDADEVREIARTALAPGAGAKLEETAQKILHRSSLKESVLPGMNLWIKENFETTAKH